jgi:hypothetical protein
LRVTMDTAHPMRIENILGWKVEHKCLTVINVGIGL